MEEKIAPLLKILQSMVAVWPWIALVIGLIALIIIVVPLGIWISLLRRNKLLKNVLEALRYQNEVLKWVGNVVRGKDSDAGPDGEK